MIWEQYVIFGWALFSIVVSWLHIGHEVKATFGGAVFSTIFWLFVIWVVKTQLVPV